MPQLREFFKKKEDKPEKKDGEKKITPNVVHIDNKIICFSERTGVRCIPKPEVKRDYFTPYEAWQNSVDNSGHFDYKTKKRRK